MTDLEMTRLCAEAMGLLVQHTTGDSVWRLPYHNEINDPRLSRVTHLKPYDPLHDDAQAMALVKKMRLDCVSIGDYGANPRWHVSHIENLNGSVEPDLNRAIVECVAKMQAAKKAA